MRAIGTTAVVAVTAAHRADEALALLAGQLAAIDQACSRFRDDSELRRVEERSAGRPIGVTPLLFEALEVACVVAVQTAGTVDPTIGSALVELGYDRDFEGMCRDLPASGHRPQPAIEHCGNLGCHLGRKLPQVGQAPHAIGAHLRLQLHQQRRGLLGIEMPKDQSRRLGVLAHQKPGQFFGVSFFSESMRSELISSERASRCTMVRAPDSPKALLSRRAAASWPPTARKSCAAIIS